MKKIYLDLSNFIAEKNKKFIEFPIKTIGKIKDKRFKIEKTPKGKIQIEKFKKELIVHFNIEIKISLICDRCLRKFLKEINLNFSRKLKFKPKTEEEIEIINNKIEILEPIRQEIILNIPPKILCQDKCRGIKVQKTSTFYLF